MIKRVTSMLLVAVLAATPVLASGPGEEKPITEGIDAAARAVVVETDTTAPVQAMEDGSNTGQVVIGIGLILGGVGLVLRGAKLKQDEADLFGRRKDLDSQLAIAGGIASAALGAVILRNGLRN